MIRPPKGWNRNPSKKLIAAGKCREVGYKIIFSSFFFIIDIKQQFTLNLFRTFFL